MWHALLHMLFLIDAFSVSTYVYLNVEELASDSFLVAPDLLGRGL